MLEGLRAFLTISFFIYASWSDYKTREVSNTVWAVLAPPTFALTVLQFLMFHPELLQTYLLSFTITSALALVLFYAGAFGGADAKAFMCLALALPVYPEHILQPLHGFIPLLFPLTVFTNAVLLAALSVFYTLFRNLLWKSKVKKGLFEGLEHESFSHKMLALITGYKVKISKLRETDHLYPLEDTYADETDGRRRKLLMFPKDEERQEIVERISEAAGEGGLQNEVWTTPGLPMLIFITVGLVIALVWGDIVWIILRSILI